MHTDMDYTQCTRTVLVSERGPPWAVLAGKSLVQEMVSAYTVVGDYRGLPVAFIAVYYQLTLGVPAQHTLLRCILHSPSCFVVAPKALEN